MAGKGSRLARRKENLLALDPRPLDVVAETRVNDMWRFPFTRGLRNDLRHGSRPYAGQIDRCLREVTRGGPSGETYSDVELYLKTLKVEEPCRT